MVPFVVRTKAVVRSGQKVEVIEDVASAFRKGRSVMDFHWKAIGPDRSLTGSHSGELVWCVFVGVLCCFVYPRLWLNGVELFPHFCQGIASNSVWSRIQNL